MLQHQEATEGALPGEGSGRDPLASPTLAALYASQGHADLAEVIYSQLGRRPGEGAAGAPGGDISRQAAPGPPLLDRLLALREAARRIRGAGRGHPGPQTNHDR